MSFISIFTPTFNRGHLLPRLYKSLLSQKFKDFEWLIVDDGLTDNTKELIKAFEKEAKIKIIYINQTNQGKHIAYNTALKNISSETFITIDSDDYLVENALMELNIAFERIKTDNRTIGLSGKMTFHDGEINQNDESVILKTKIATQYQFPTFTGEKFCRESLVWDRILKDYLICKTEIVITICEYQEDGLSSNSWHLMKKSPRYSLLLFSEKIMNSKYSKNEKIIFANSYWDIALNSKNISWSNKLIGINFYWTIRFFIKKALNQF